MTDDEPVMSKSWVLFDGMNVSEGEQRFASLGNLVMSAQVELIVKHRAKYKNDYKYGDYSHCYLCVAYAEIEEVLERVKVFPIRNRTEEDKY